MEYYEMSGTSMASPIVAATAALMIQQDPSLNPGSVKARLMMTARKPRFGNPLISGAGSLDILAALRASWTAIATPSPGALVSVDTGQITFENTSVLWGDEAFSLRALWASSVAWADPSAYLDPFLMTDGAMWPPGQSDGNGELWPESEVWPEGEMWPDTPAWQPAVLEPEATGPVASEALATGFSDP
jgi:subtilisin family serine protease